MSIGQRIAERAMTCGFLRQADELKQGLRTGAIGRELPEEIGRLKMEFERLGEGVE